MPRPSRATAHHLSEIAPTATPPPLPRAGSFIGAKPPVDTVATNDKVCPHTGHPLGRGGYASSLPMLKMTKMLPPVGVKDKGRAPPRLGSVAEDESCSGVPAVAIYCGWSRKSCLIQPTCLSGWVPPSSLRPERSRPAAIN